MKDVHRERCAPHNVLLALTSSLPRRRTDQRNHHDNGEHVAGHLVHRAIFWQSRALFGTLHG